MMTNKRKVAIANAPLQSKRGASFPPPTYTSGSRHNLYRPSVCSINIRTEQELRRRVELRALELGVDRNTYIENLLVRDTKDIVLTNADKRIIATRIADNINRQKEKIK